VAERTHSTILSSAPLKNPMTPDTLTNTRQHKLMLLHPHFNCCCKHIPCGYDVTAAATSLFILWQPHSHPLSPLLQPDTAQATSCTAVPCCELHCCCTIPG
jgi:hypothetical protein